MRWRALLTLIALSAGACGIPPPKGKDDSTTGTTGSTGSSGNQQMPTEKPPRATTIVKAVDSSGGEVRLDTAAGLTFPPGALSDSTLITIREVDETIPGYTMFSKVYYFEPEGQTFAEPFIAEISFAGDISAAKLYWSQPGNANAFDEVDSVALGTTLTATVTHFSRAFVGDLIPVVMTLTPPAAPSGLVAKAGDTDVDLSWGASAGASLYKVFSSSVSGGPYSLVDTTNELGYTHSGRVNGTTYFYTVKANNADGDSDASNEATAVPQDLETPTGFVLTPGNTTMGLAWDAPPHATASTKYRVRRNGVPITDTANLVYTDTGRTNGVDYSYTVAALDPALAESPESGELTRFPFKLPGAFAVSGPSVCSYDVSWAANADGTNHYEIQYGITGFDFVLHPSGTTGITGTSFQCAFRYAPPTQSNSFQVSVKACYDATPNRCGDEAYFPAMVMDFPVACTGVTTCP